MVALCAAALSPAVGSHRPDRHPRSAWSFSRPIRIPNRYRSAGVQKSLSWESWGCADAWPVDRRSHYRQRKRTCRPPLLPDDCTVGAVLLEQMPATPILHANKCYDSNAIRQQVDGKGVCQHSTQGKPEMKELQPRLRPMSADRPSQPNRVKNRFGSRRACDGRS